MSDLHSLLLDRECTETSLILLVLLLVDFEELLLQILEDLNSMYIIYFYFFNSDIFEFNIMKIKV